MDTTRLERYFRHVAGLDLAEQIAEPTWWGVEFGDHVAGSADIFQMISTGMSEGLPAPIAVDTRPWAAETIIQVAPSHKDDWREWWHCRDAGPWAVTRQRHGRYIHHRSYGNYRGWRLVIFYVTEDDTDD